MHQQPLAPDACSPSLMQSVLFFSADGEDRERAVNYIRYLTCLSGQPGFDITVMAPNDTTLARFARHHDIRFYPLSDFSRTLLQRTPQLWPILSAMGRFRYDVAITHHSLACRGLKQIARRVVGICHDDHFVGFEVADKVLALTSGGASIAEHMFERKQGIAILPYPHLCDHDEIKPLPEDGSLTIGAGGRMDEAAGLGSFLHAAQLIQQELPDARFVIAGAGGEEHDLRELADQIAPFVEFAGSLSHEEMAQSFDIYCSTARYSAYEPTLCAMMDAGLACLATCTNGPMDILKAGMVAPIFPIDDAFQMALAAIQLGKDPEALKQNKRSCYDRIREEDFDPDLFSQHLIELLLEQPDVALSSNAPDSL